MPLIIRAAVNAQLQRGNTHRKLVGSRRPARGRGPADRPTLCGCTYSGPFSGLILSLTVTGMARVQKRRPERPNAAVPHLETRRYISAPRRAGGAWRCVEGSCSGVKLFEPGPCDAT